MSKLTSPGRRPGADGWVDAFAGGGPVGGSSINPAAVEPVPLPVRPRAGGVERKPKRRRAGVSAPITLGASPSTAKVADTGVLPYSAVGKLITGYSPTTAGHGTAFVLGYRLIVTAAHCVTGGKWVEFIPNYGGEKNPRRWKLRFWQVHPKYGEQRGGDLRYDFAIGITDPADDPLAPTTGSLGWLGVPHAKADCTSVGYPSDPPHEFQFDGNAMWASRGEFVGTGGADLTAARNDMTRGCSGGPWVVDLGVVGGWRAVGLNSHVRGFDQRVMYSPVFDDDFAGMIAAARAKEREFNGDVPPEDRRWVRFV